VSSTSDTRGATGSGDAGRGDDVPHEDEAHREADQPEIGAEGGAGAMGRASQGPGGEGLKDASGGEPHEGLAPATGEDTAEGSYQAHFRVWRGDDESGTLKDFTVEVNEGEVVLDIIHRLQATQAPDLAVRWNCKAGKCGSCSAEINGRPRLLCMTRMSIFEQTDTITVTPLRAFPVIRDLVPDVSYNYIKAREVPGFVPPQGLAPGEYRMQQEDVERSQEFRKCIECFLCQDTCHVVRDHEENKESFAGPRFLMRIAELDMHPLDAAEEQGLDRKTSAQDEHGLGYCNITKCCTEVCPEGIKITDNALIPMKERAADRKYDPLVWLGDKIRRRK
jgi:succinate dehydrogenase / fumarate reductase, iron-sulfur subunit